MRHDCIRPSSSYKPANEVRPTPVADTLEEAPGEAIIGPDGNVYVRVAPDTFILPPPMPRKGLLGCLLDYLHRITGSEA